MQSNATVCTQPCLAVADAAHVHASPRPPMPDLLPRDVRKVCAAWRAPERQRQGGALGVGHGNVPILQGGGHAQPLHLPRTAAAHDIALAKRVSRQLQSTGTESTAGSTLRTERSCGWCHGAPSPSSRPPRYRLYGMPGRDVTLSPRRPQPAPARRTARSRKSARRLAAPGPGSWLPAASRPAPAGQTPRRPPPGLPPWQWSRQQSAAVQRGERAVRVGRRYQPRAPPPPQCAISAPCPPSSAPRAASSAPPPLLHASTANLGRSLSMRRASATTNAPNSSREGWRECNAAQDGQGDGGSPRCTHHSPAARRASASCCRRPSLSAAAAAGAKRKRKGREHTTSSAFCR